MNSIFEQAMRPDDAARQKTACDELVALYETHARHTQSYDFQCSPDCAPHTINVHEWLATRQIVRWPAVPAVHVCQTHERLLYNPADPSAALLADLYTKRFPLQTDEEPCRAECIMVSVPHLLHAQRAWRPPWLPVYCCTAHATLHACLGLPAACRRADAHVACAACRRTTTNNDRDVQPCSECLGEGSCACHGEGPDDAPCAACVIYHTPRQRCTGCRQRRLCYFCCPLNANAIDAHTAHICLFSHRVVSYGTAGDAARRQAVATDFTPASRASRRTAVLRFSETAQMMLMRWIPHALAASAQSAAAPELVDARTATDRVTRFLIESSAANEDDGTIHIVPRDIGQFVPLLYRNFEQATRASAVVLDTIGVHDAAAVLFALYNSFFQRRIPLRDALDKIASPGFILRTPNVSARCTPHLQQIALLLTRHAPASVAAWLARGVPLPDDDAISAGGMPPDYALRALFRSHASFFIDHVEK